MDEWEMQEQINELTIRLHEEREAREKAEAERDQLLSTAKDVLDSDGIVEKDESCPVCFTYTHKHWCWYPDLRAIVESYTSQYSPEPEE